MHKYSPRIKQTFICEITGSCNIAAEESGLLGCDTLSWGEQSVMFQRIVMPSSSGPSIPSSCTSLTLKRHKGRAA